MTAKLGKHMTARAVGMAPREGYTIMDMRGNSLGTVEWYERSKDYAFEPEAGVVFSHDYLNEIAAFCKRLTREVARSARSRCGCHGSPPDEGCACWCHKHRCATMRADGEP